MHLKRTISLTTALISVAAMAQAAQPAAHHGLLGRLLHKPASTAPATSHHLMSKPAMGSLVHSGNIIGNKNTHVYHLPGDKNLPEPKNRVYFKSVAAATAAGYHASGSGKTITKTHSVKKMTAKNHKKK